MKDDIYAAIGIFLMVVGTLVLLWSIAEIASTPQVITITIQETS